MTIMEILMQACNASIKADAAEENWNRARLALDEAERVAAQAADALAEAEQRVAESRNAIEEPLRLGIEQGLDKDRFYDALQRMKSVMYDLGAVDAAGANQAPTASAAERAEPKARAPRKRKGQSAEQEAAAGQATAPETVVEDSLPAALSDRDGHAPASTDVDATASSVDTDNARRPAGADFADAVRAFMKSEPDVVIVEEAAVAEFPVSADLSVGADIVVAEDVAIVEATADEGDAADAPADEKVDNSIAVGEIRELIDDFVEDSEVRSALHSSLSIIEWHAGEVKNSVIRPAPSPLRIEAIVEAVEERYVPANVTAHFAVASARGVEKLADILTWFAEVIELVSDARPDLVKQIKFAGPASDVTARSAEEVVTQPDPASVSAELPSDAAGDEPEYAEAIDGMELFTQSEEEAAEDEAERIVEPLVATPVPAPSPAPAVVAAPVPVKRPSWLKS
jgi:hypothetical protein